MENISKILLYLMACSIQNTKPEDKVLVGADLEKLLQDVYKRQRPARALILKVKVLSAPVSGKHIANKTRVSAVR